MIRDFRLNKEQSAVVRKSLVRRMEHCAQNLKDILSTPNFEKPNNEYFPKEFPVYFADGKCFNTKAYSDIESALYKVIRADYTKLTADELAQVIKAVGVYGNPDNELMCLLVNVYTFKLLNIDY